MASSIVASHPSHAESARFGTFNVSNAESPIERERASGKGVQSDPSSNEHSLISRDGAGDTDDSSPGEASVARTRLKKVNSLSLTSRSPQSTPRNRMPVVNGADLTTIPKSPQVKISALLYEITERTERLAQPRQRRVEETGGASRKPQQGNNQPNMLRILELATPRVNHESSSKPVSFVSPSALRATATRRTIELSQPRGDGRCKLPQNDTDQPGYSRIRVSPMSRRTKRKQLGLSKGKEEELLGLLREQVLRANSDNGGRHKRRRHVHKSRLSGESAIRRKRASRFRLDRPDSDRSIVIVDLGRRRSGDPRGPRRCGLPRTRRRLR